MTRRNWHVSNRVRISVSSEYGKQQFPPGRLVATPQTPIDVCPMNGDNLRKDTFMETNEEKTPRLEFYWFEHNEDSSSSWGQLNLSIHRLWRLRDELDSVY